MRGDPPGPPQQLLPGALPHAALEAGEGPDFGLPRAQQQRRLTLAAHGLISERQHGGAARTGERDLGLVAASSVASASGTSSLGNAHLYVTDGSEQCVAHAPDLGRGFDDLTQKQQPRGAQHRRLKRARSDPRAAHTAGARPGATHRGSDELHRLLELLVAQRPKHKLVQHDRLSRARGS